MAKVNFKRIEDSSLIDNYDIEDGSFWVTGDGKTYIDYGNERISIAGTPDAQMSDISRNTVENKVIKDYVDDSIDNTKLELGGKILWTNPNPNNGMITKTITLSDDDYDMLEVIYYNWISQKYYSSSKGKKGTDIALYSMISTNSKAYMSIRVISYVSDTSLTVNNNITLVDNNSFTSGQINNDWGIPVYIIGYKTGLFE